ncbi:uncharacterized ferritin-like protein (DUF455 family) [Streptomyces sp. 846.5]|nr:DUF455 family protein [Streptomyces sp. 846.5]TDU04447.1 uncharacterized ferritin-like protein (DUF455 family) [Streptomyces sp. 846.5]
MLTNINPRLGMSVDETAQSLDEFAIALNFSVLLLASWTCDIPEIEVKTVLADHLYRDARMVSALRGRIGELAKDPSPQINPEQSTSSSADIDALSRVDATMPRLHGMYFAFKSDLARRMRLHAVKALPVADEPTVRLLLDSASDLDAQITAVVEVMDQLQVLFPELTPMDDAAAAWERTRSVGEPGYRHHYPKVPRRDHRFRVLPDAPPPTAVHDADATAACVHGVLMATEIPTIEACGRAIADFPAMPWEFILDMARQAWDESRHAQMLYERMIQLGGRPGMDPVDLQIWEMTDDLPLELRLAVHQRTGEWLGVDGAIANAARLRDYGDHATAQLYDFITADEITHVAVGNKWVHRIAGSEARVLEIQEAALQRRLEFGETVNGSPRLAFNREVCERAGFTDREIAALEQRRTGRRAAVGGMSGSSPNG